MTTDPETHPEGTDEASPLDNSPNAAANDFVDAESVRQEAASRPKELYEASLANACAAGRIADELRGQNILVLDMTKLTSIVDFFVIATATSKRQMHAIADEVNRKLKREDGNTRISIEGYRTEGNWVLADYGDVVLHVFTPEGRLLYRLEQLWADAVPIDWQTGKPTQASSESDS
ncbi:MAG: ribosome silencing factor [Planctomycetaceae bacterium]